MPTTTHGTISIDPFDPYQNPLGTRGLNDSFLSSAHIIKQGKAYAVLITEQEVLDISGIDVGLALKMAQLQLQLRELATNFFNIILPDFERLVRDAGSLASLIQTFDRLDRRTILEAYSNPAKRQSLVTLLDTVSEKAGEDYIDLLTLITHVALVGGNLLSLSADLDDLFEAAIAGLTDALKATVTDINELTKAVHKNIEDIVAGGRAAGDAVTELGVGIITVISGSINAGDVKKPEDKDKDKDKPKGDGAPPKLPSIEFAVHAIQAGGDGVAKWSAAQLALRSNNVALADAYQKLAGESALLAVAKVVQVQKGLFATNIHTLKVDCDLLKENWSDMRTGLNEFKTAIGGVSDENTASKLAGFADAGRKHWSVLRDSLTRIEEQLQDADFGSLDGNKMSRIVGTIHPSTIA